MIKLVHNIILSFKCTQLLTSHLDIYTFHITPSDPLSVYGGNTKELLVAILNKGKFQRCHLHYGILLKAIQDFSKIFKIQQNQISSIKSTDFRSKISCCAILTPFLKHGMHFLLLVSATIFLSLGC